MRMHPQLPGFTGRHGAVEPSVVQRWRWWVWGVLAVVWLSGAAGSLWAQKESRGGKSALGDKTKGKTKMMDHYRAKLEVADDAEWSIIQKRLESVLSAEHELQAALAAGQHKSHSSKSSGNGAAGTGRSEPARAFDGTEELRALQQSVEGKAPAHEIKPRLARVRELLKVRQEKLANAREELRAVLSARQEAIAVLSGLLR